MAEISAKEDIVKKKKNNYRYYKRKKVQTAETDLVNDNIKSQKIQNTVKPAQKQNAKNSNASKGHNEDVTFKEKLRVIPLGGLDEIGKNTTVLEYGDEMIVIDAGLAFPSGDMLGIDLVIPDYKYLVSNYEKIKAVILTHGHEDHIGGLPYLLKQINVPVYGTRLTLGIVRAKLEEHKLKKIKLHEVKAGSTITLGKFKIEFIHTNHSIPDSTALSITTPVGIVIFTGDFKIDTTPIDGGMIDLARFGELGKKGVLALFSDSTNAERPGMAMSEKVVGEAFDNLFKTNTKRIIVATFASNVHRVQQVIDAAVKFGRKVAVSGRSMVNIIKVASELGMMNIPDGTMIDLSMISRYTDDKLVLITTGSQGEPMSALARMASSDHRNVEIGPNDMVIISANPIPGNEKTVSKVVNELIKLVAEFISERLREIHVSGHACQEELKMMISLVRPKFFVPIHGEYKHIYKHAQLAKRLGYTNDNIIMMETGKVLEFTESTAKINGSVPSGAVLIDGLGVGDVGNIVLRDRKLLSEDGLIIIVASIDAATGQLLAGPDIVSRGFVYVREAEDMIETARKIARDIFEKYEKNYTRDWQALKSEVKDELSRYLYSKTKRSPMILPVIMDI
ncbi:MAG: ribonuclease J [Bacillota bacterium]|nr:ribonuclease J [Bacillota bacterium]